MIFQGSFLTMQGGDSTAICKIIVEKFLTLNVTKFVRQIVNFSEERLLDSPKKATYLKLLEVFCRFQGKVVRQN